jgi:23S rRNA (uracil1939-C5)-methyltransferase
VARPAQLAAKQAIASTALRRLEGLAIHPIEDPAPALGWRRRARFHVAGGRTGLFALGSHRVLPIASCPQLVPALDAARAAAAGATPPDGELALVGDAAGAIAVGVERPWRGADRLVGRAGIAGVEVAGSAHGDPVIELEPGLWVGPRDFAQASRAGNAALRARVVAAVGAPPAAPHGSAHLLELFAGAGNLTRALVAAGWDVDASDVEPPRRAVPWRFARATAADALAAAASAGAAPAAVVLDPPRTGALDAMEGIARLAPGVVVYVSCDPATLARDAARLVAAGYRATDAWPLDLMPQTAHVEVVLRLERGAPR